MYYKTRSHFSQTDYQFIAQSLGKTQSERTAMLNLTDDPAVFSHMLRNNKLFQSILKDPAALLSVSSSLYFYCLVYQALDFKSLADDDIADYISGVCVDFTDNDILWQYSTDASERMLYFVDLNHVLSDYNAVQQYHMHQFMGNAALFLTGFFPDLIYKRELKKGAPSFEYYENVGHTHFEAAATGSAKYESDATPVLYKLSEYFGEIRSAINIYVDAYMNLHNPKSILERIDRQSSTLDEESFRQSLNLE